MRYKNVVVGGLLVCLFGFVGGCSSMDSMSKNGLFNWHKGSVDTARANGLKDANGLDISGAELSAKLSDSTFYFGLDKSAIDEDGIGFLDQAISYLLKNPGAKIRIEGHTDERGSAEYNVALGWRRGRAVSDYLEQKGVSAKQLTVLSYGKEKPAVLGHSETAWGKNRRVSIVFLAS